MGLFVTFEGPEGAGKSTQARALAARLKARGEPVVVTREPGGTPLGNRIRSILLRPKGDPIAPRAETLLYAASRSQLVEDVIRPHLAEGYWVISDRYADSTLAYQGHGRKLELEAVAGVVAFATGGLQPDLTVLLDTSVATGLARKRPSTAGWTRFEAEEVEFHERVRQGYLSLAREHPCRWLVLDGSLPPRRLARAVWVEVEKRRGS